MSKQPKPNAFRMDWRKERKLREQEIKELEERRQRYIEQRRQQVTKDAQQRAKMLAMAMGGPLQEAPRRDVELRFQTEPILGHRVWHVCDYITHSGVAEKRLQSVGVVGNWPGYQRMEAVCTKQHHAAPFVTCHCGMWALKNEQSMWSTRERYGAVVWGTANLWGRVLECRDGWRAQYAYPQHLYTYDEKLARELEQTYGVPVDVVEGSMIPSLDTFSAHHFPPGAYWTPPPNVWQTYTTTGSGTSPNNLGSLTPLTVAQVPPFTTMQISFHGTGISGNVVASNTTGAYASVEIRGG